MPNSYHMVVFNLIALIALWISVLFYKYIYPKKKVSLFILLILISILPIISVFRGGVYQSGDFNLHIYRAIDFYKSLSEGNIMPSWAETLNASYGYPLFIFNYSLPYYFISLIHFLGASFVLSMKVFLASNFILAGIFTYIFAKQLFKKDINAFIVSIFYQFAPYHLITLHFKVSIGEILFMTLLPLFFFFVVRLKENQSLKNLLSTGLTLGMLFLSHMFLGIILIPIVFFFFFINKLNKKVLNFFILAIFIGILISLYQWAPSLIYSNYLFTYKYPINVEALYYPSLGDLLYSAWRYGFLFQGPKGEISSLIGYAQIFAVLAFIFFIAKHKLTPKLKRSVSIMLTLIVFLIAFMLPVSKIFWTNIPFLGAAGPHRLIIFCVFFIAILAGYLADVLKKKYILYLILMVAIFQTILNWGNRTMIPAINDDVLRAGIPLSTASGEGHFYANTKWVNYDHPWFSKIPKANLEVINGYAKIQSVQRLSTQHIYKVYVSKDTLFKENTLFFPEWNIKANGKIVPMIIDEFGTINFKLDRGNYLIEASYNDSFLYQLIKIISGLTLLTTSGLIIFLQLKKYSSLHSSH